MNSDRLERLKPRILNENLRDSNLDPKGHLLPLPNSYRELLSEFGGAVVFDNGAKFKTIEQSPLNDKDGWRGLDILFGLGGGRNSIAEMRETYDGELPPGFIPLGEAPGGNLICVDDGGAVHLWDHESLRDGPTWRIADSIVDFLERLEPDESELGSTDGIIESETWFDF